MGGAREGSESLGPEELDRREEARLESCESRDLAPTCAGRIRRKSGAVTRAPSISGVTSKGRCPPARDMVLTHVREMRLPIVGMNQADMQTLVSAQAGPPFLLGTCRRDSRKRNPSPQNSSTNTHLGYTLQIKSPKIYHSISLTLHAMHLPIPMLMSMAQQDKPPSIAGKSLWM